MDKLIEYRMLTQKLLTEHADLIRRTSTSGLDTYTIFDESTDNYMLFRAGWLGKKRIHTPILHVRLENDKLWIEEDSTEAGIATDFLEARVPKHDIILAFRHPSVRPMTEFARYLILLLLTYQYHSVHKSR